MLSCSSGRAVCGRHMLLGGEIQRGGRLIGYYQPVAAGERQRDADPLALAAGELHRVTGHHIRRGVEIHLAQQRHGARGGVASTLIRCLPTVTSGLSADAES